MDESIVLAFKEAINNMDKVGLLKKSEDMSSIKEIDKDTFDSCINELKKKYIPIWKSRLEGMGINCSTLDGRELFFNYHRLIDDMDIHTKMKHAISFGYAEDTTDFRAFIKLSPSIQKERKAGCVYFIKDKLNGYVKIGSSIDVDNRLKILKCGNANNFEIMYIIKDGNFRKLEHKFHKVLKTFRVTGEWFDFKNLGHKNLRKLVFNLN